jgi:hypothetical protein
LTPQDFSQACSIMRGAALRPNLKNKARILPDFVTSSKKKVDNSRHYSQSISCANERISITAVTRVIRVPCGPASRDSNRHLWANNFN